jgi:hypothetical protein
MSFFSNNFERNSVMFFIQGHRIQHDNKTDTKLCFQTFLKFLILIISIVVLMQKSIFNKKYILAYINI